MTTIKNYNYSEKEISTFIVDSNGYLWVAFETDGTNCAFQKVSVNDPLQVYFDIDIAVDEIVALYIDGSYIYLAYNDATYIGARKSLANPTITYTNISIPAGIVEAPVDVLVNGADLFYLMPGNTSGQNCQIVKMTITGTFVETIDLVTVTNAVSFTMDSEGEIWVITENSPADYVRVYEDSGGVYSYEVNN